MPTSLGSVYTFRPHPGREEVWAMGVGLFGNEVLNASDVKLKSIKSIMFQTFRGRRHSGGFRSDVHMAGSITGGMAAVGSNNNSVTVLTGQVRGTGITSAYGGTLFIGTVGSLSASFLAVGK